MTTQMRDDFPKEVIDVLASRVNLRSSTKLEDAQELAGHANARTTRPDMRGRRKLAQLEAERVQL